MCWKLNGFVLVYVLTVMTLPPVGLCGPHPASTRKSNLHMARRNDRSSVLTKRRPEDGAGQPPDPRLEKGEPRNPPVSDQAPNGKSSVRRTERRPKPRSRPRLSEKCSEGEMESVSHGRFSISGQLETNGPNVNYRAGPAPGRAGVGGLQVSGSGESWQRLQPKVECGDHAMSLAVRRRRAGQLLLDRVKESPVPLSQLPPRCGYSVHTTVTDLILKAQYDACHVTQEDGRYVLPLLWRMTPVKISCPVSPIQPGASGPSSLCCFPDALTLKVQGWSAAEELRVNVRGEWTPVQVLAEPCGYTLERREAEILITVPFFTCGVTVKDGKHSLSLKIRENTFILSCPASPIQELPQIHQPQVMGSPYLTRGQTAPVPGSLVPFPWGPPFYLAPLYYPHPTDHQRYPGPDVHAAYDRPEPPSLTLEPTLGPQPLPAVDAQPDYQDLYSRQVPGDHGVHTSLSSADEMERLTRLQQEQKPPVLGFSERDSVKATGFSLGVKAPTLQPPSHAFNPYYHYYHHPKIPLSSLPQNPDPQAEGHEELASTNSPTGEFSSFHQPFPLYTFPTSPEFVHKAPAPHAPHPLQHYPLHYFHYFPYVPQSNTLAPLHPDMSTETSPSPDRSFAHKVDINPYKDQPSTDEVIHSPEWLKHPDVKPELEDTTQHSASVAQLPPSSPPERHPFPRPVSNHNPPRPHPFYLHPYHFYQMYYGPLLRAGNQVSLTNGALDRPHTPTPPAKSLRDVPSSTVGSRKAESNSQLPLGSDANRKDPVVSAEAGYPPQLLYSPLDAYYSPPMTPSLAFWCPGEGAAEESPDNKMRGCTVGQRLVFVVLEPIASPPARPSEGKPVSCTLHRLTSDPAIYTLALEGRGWNMHVFVPTAFDLLGVRSQHHHTNVHGNTPVRLDCSSPLVSLGDVKPHVMDQPTLLPVRSTPATSTVHLRIATDQTFSSYHPEAHLPLSLVRGRPLYLEVRLLDAPEPELVLLVHSCLAYTHTPYPSWMLLYHTCRSRGESQLLPSPHSDRRHIWRIRVSSFQALPSESPSNRAGGGSAHLVDPEIYFFCWTDVCSAADGDCTVGCIHGPNSDV